MSRIYFTDVFATARKIIDVVCLIQMLLAPMKSVNTSQT